MGEIIMRYGSALEKSIVIVLIIGLIVVLLANDSNGVVYKAFSNLLDTFFKSASSYLPTT